MAKYLKNFKNLTSANVAGANGLYSPQVNFIDGFNHINYDNVNNRFTCDFNESGETYNIQTITTEYSIKQFQSQPFIGETYIEDYDFTEANRFLINRFTVDDVFTSVPYGNVCSSCRNGSFIGRNLDWYIKNYAMLVVHMPANSQKNRYASLAVCSSSPFITKEVIANGLLPDKNIIDGKLITGIRNNIPVFTTDGINEKGVCVNTNIVLHEDGVREGYIPCSGHGGELISFVALPRFILDNCQSCDDAIGKLSALSVTQAYKGPLSTEDSHLMVSDANKTIIFEWYNNEMVYTEYKNSNNFKSNNGLPCIMTNFYNCKAEEVTISGETNWNNLLTIHPYAMGIERFDCLIDELENINSVEDMEQHIEKVLYSKTFIPSTSWFTENAREGYFKENNQWKYYKNFARTQIENATDVIDAMTKCNDTYQMEAINDFGSLDKQMNILNSGGESQHWYTELTSIFDMTDKSIHILPQEGWYKKQYIKFSL